jgi:hypothetical protein
MWRNPVPRRDDMISMAVLPLQAAGCYAFARKVERREKEREVVKSA